MNHKWLILLLILFSSPSHEFEKPEINYRLGVMVGDRVVMECEGETKFNSWEMKTTKDWTRIYFPNSPSSSTLFEEITSKHIVISNASSIHQASYRCLDFEKFSIPTEFMLQVKTVDFVCEERRETTKPCICPTIPTTASTTTSTTASTTTSTTTVSMSTKKAAILFPGISNDWICFDTKTEEIFTNDNKTYNDNTNANNKNNNKNIKEILKDKFCGMDKGGTEWLWGQKWLCISVAINILLIITLVVIAVCFCLAKSKAKRESRKGEFLLDIYDTIPDNQDNFEYPSFARNQAAMSSTGRADQVYLTPNPHPPTHHPPSKNAFNNSTEIALQLQKLIQQLPQQQQQQLQQQLQHQLPQQQLPQQPPQQLPPQQHPSYQALNEQEGNMKHTSEATKPDFITEPNHYTALQKHKPDLPLANPSPTNQPDYLEVFS